MQPRLKLDIAWRRVLGAALRPERPAPPVSAYRGVFKEGALVPALSVRTLFDAALTALSAQPGEAIVMSAVTIENMAEIARGHGLVIHAVDIDPDTLQPPPGALAQAQARSGARIAVVSRLFGDGAPIADAARLAASGCALIEDCAQGFPPDSPSQEAGLGVKLFSFGPIKRATALGGALAVSPDISTAKALEAVLEGYPALSGAWYRNRALKYLALKALSLPPVYAALIQGLQISGRDPDAVIGGAARGFAGADLMTAIRRRPPGALLDVMARQIADCPPAAPRRALAQAFAQRLPEGLHAPAAGLEAHAWWLFPVITQEPDALVAALRKAGFDATRGATSLRVIDHEAAPRAAALLANIVYLPHPAEMGARPRERLLAALYAAAEAPRGRRNTRVV
ncbi:MAG: DegT/DnrJ/EryC1/StrS family aminotransferase [Oceanicaulis sp.]